jgi:hypothetical protein
MPPEVFAIEKGVLSLVEQPVNGYRQRQAANFLESQDNHRVFDIDDFPVEAIVGRVGDFEDFTGQSLIGADFLGQILGGGFPSVTTAIIRVMTWGRVAMLLMSRSRE